MENAVLLFIHVRGEHQYKKVDFIYKSRFYLYKLKLNNNIEFIYRICFLNSCHSMIYQGAMIKEIKQEQCC